MKTKILAIDGGGTRGIIPATILDCLYQDIKVHPRELFDVLAGTSTGGIICIAYAANIPTTDLVSLYLEKSEEIFFERFLDRAQGLDEHLRANYSNTKFKKILEKLLGNTTLKDIELDPTFGKKGKDLLITTFDLAPASDNDDNKNYRPIVIHSSFIRDQDFSLVDLALMTSAGPTYFPIYKSKYIDGGVALNNPSMAALAYALNSSKSKDEKHYRYPDGVRKGLNVSTGDIQLLSLSTGTSNKNRIEASVVKNGNWGNIQWIKYLPDLLTEGNMQSTAYYVKQILDKQQYHRVEAFFDKSDIPVLYTQPNGIKMDTKDPAILNAMHDYAVKIYKKERTHILKTIERSLH